MYIHPEPHENAEIIQVTEKVWLVTTDLWAGFLKARKKGTFNIINIINNGVVSNHNDIIR